VKAALNFGSEEAELKVKVAISSVDEEGAMKNLEVEIPHWNFEQVKKESQKMWEAQLFDHGHCRWSIYPTYSRVACRWFDWFA